ncbi:MAG: hypothetical protein EAZ55_04295 [Cytophagales bacterium]|nr:MAG: hypothetical protein EAZ55_04295 [Cytophagales bacterium]
MLNLKAQNPSDLYETFFIGERGLQYFIKPISFEDNLAKTTLEIDITFRYKNEIKDSATVNFFLISKEVIKQIDSLHIINPIGRIQTKNIQFLFVEKRKDLFYSRFTTQYSLKDICEIFKNQDWLIIGYFTNKTSRKFQPSAKTLKNLAKVNKSIFVLF